MKSMPETIKNNRFLSALFILLIFYLLNYHANDLVRLFFSDVTGYPRWGARMIVEMVGCFAAVMVFYKTWLSGALKEMAIIKPEQPPWEM